jgi:hypothetical protein
LLLDEVAALDPHVHRRLLLADVSIEVLVILDLILLLVECDINL